MQFDLFEFSRDTSLRNEVITALENLNPTAARSARATLVASFPHDISLPAIEQVLAVLEQRATTPFASHAEVLAAQQVLQAASDGVQQLLERAAGPWLAARWQELAGRAAHLPYQAQAGFPHAAALYLRAGAWAELARAVENIASWRRIPQPLGWMVLARHRQHGLETAWPLLCELLWMQAGQGETVLTMLADARLNRLLRRFDADFDTEAVTGHELAWFPAFAALADSALAAGIRQADAGQDSNAERGARLIARLLQDEQRGDQIALVDARKRLQHLQPALFALYMRTR